MNYDTIFLDRDGVINRKLDNDYVKRWSEFEFLPRVKEALQLLTQAGARLIIVTNQRGIARGWMTEADLQDIHAQMRAELEAAGARIAAIYYCPHDKDQCDCRKPEVGLFLQAQREFPDIDWAQAALIGDSASDMEAGAKLGCRHILIGADAAYECAVSLDEAALRLLSFP